MNCFPVHHIVVSVVYNCALLLALGFRLAKDDKTLTGRLQYFSVYIKKIPSV